MGRLEGSVAIVTGSARGIGRGIAVALAHEGADIVVGDIDTSQADETVAAVQAAGRRAAVVELDVTNVASAEGCVAKAIEEYGRVDVLVNNAGVFGQHIRPEAIELEDWDLCYEVNVKGVWIMSRAVIPHFQERGEGKIVNIASVAGRKGVSRFPNYSASKAAAINLTQALALELARSNINVNAVCPGLLWTDMWRQMEGLYQGEPSAEVVEERKFFHQMVQGLSRLGREQTPEDIGKAVAFLASDDARNITGQSLNVDGGIEMD